MLARGRALTRAHSSAPGSKASSRSLVPHGDRASPRPACDDTVVGGTGPDDPPVQT